MSLSLETVSSEDKIDFASIAAEKLQEVTCDIFGPKGGIHKPNGWIQQCHCLYLFPFVSLRVDLNPSKTKSIRSEV